MTDQQAIKYFVYFFIAVVTTYCEASLFVYAYLQVLSIGKALVAHVLINMALTLLLFIQWKHDHSLAFLAILITLTFFCGPFGSAVAVLALISLFVFSYIRTTSVEELMAMIFPERNKDKMSMLFERVKFGMENYDTEHLPISYTDIMTFGSLRQKRIAIERLLKHFRPQFGQALLLGINDPSNSIRVLAATAISRINDKYHEEYLALDKQVKAEPDHLKLLIEFATYCENYSALAFLDKGRSRKLIERAIAVLEHYDLLQVDNHEVLLMLGRLYFKLKHYEESRHYLERLLIKEHIAVDEAYKWYLSILFLMKEYDLLRVFARKENIVIGGTSLDHDDIVEQILLWRKGTGTLLIEGATNG